MKKLFIVLFLALFFYMPSFAASWYWIGNTPDGNQFYVDNSSVSKNYNYAYIWTKIIKPNGDYQLSKMAISRRQKSMATVSWVYYNAYGRVIASDTPLYLDWSPIVPDSLGMALYYAIWAY